MGLEEGAPTEASIPQRAEFSRRLLPHLSEMLPLAEERGLIHVLHQCCQQPKIHCAPGSGNIQVRGRVGRGMGGVGQHPGERDARLDEMRDSLEASTGA